MLPLLSDFNRKSVSVLIHYNNITCFFSYCYPNSYPLLVSLPSFFPAVLFFLYILHQFHIHCCHLLLIFPSPILLKLLAFLIIYEWRHKWVPRFTRVLLSEMQHKNTTLITTLHNMHKPFVIIRSTHT